MRYIRYSRDSAIDLDKLIPELLEMPKRVREAVRRRTVRVLQDQVGPEVLRKAQEKIPVLFGRARESGFVEKLFGGVKIGFGRGTASKYIGLLHSRDDVSHSGAQKYKYVYLYPASYLEGSSMDIRPGEWNPANIPVNYRRLFGRPIEWSGTEGSPWAADFEQEFMANPATGNQYRFSTVGYKERFGSAGFPKTGQSHFLFGKSNSAFEELKPWIRGVLTDEGRAAIDEALAGWAKTGETLA